MISQINNELNELNRLLNSTNVSSKQNILTRNINHNLQQSSVNFFEQCDEMQPELDNGNILKLPPLTRTSSGRYKKMHILDLIPENEEAKTSQNTLTTTRTKRKKSLTLVDICEESLLDTEKNYTPVICSQIESFTSTPFDARFPPINLLSNGFWIASGVSTALLIISFMTPIQIQSVQMTFSGVSHFMFSDDNMIQKKIETSHSLQEQQQIFDVSTGKTHYLHIHVFLAGDPFTVIRNMELLHIV